MSRLLIQQYLNQLQDLRKLSGTHRESVVSEAFKDLLKGWARSLDLVFVPQYKIVTSAKEYRYVDGALLHALRLPLGYWEAKDEQDDLDAEIELKFRRGYPHDNIIFEDSRQAVLIQDKHEVIRCSVEDVPKLEKLLKAFFSYERIEIAEFRAAVEQFKVDLPAVLEALRLMIDGAYSKNKSFRQAMEKFLSHVREAINPSLEEADVREMLIQHILTEDIFSKVYGEDDFHRLNNIARHLYALEEAFFTGSLKKRTLRSLDPYYSAIKAAAAKIDNHREKQNFLKAIYENFYRVYNPKAADRLGVVYTPGEIVRFMIHGADWLCEKHWGRALIDEDVQILDPATGTGTFICELLEHFRGQPAKLKQKFQKELHANEVSILPYYVANLNIEATYAAIAGDYLEYPSLCFVDTLDNVGRHTAQRGTNLDLFAGLSEENVGRIKRQNSRRISVILGNPPYNANQANENDNNKNRAYPMVDGRIRDTYIHASTAQKTKLYDMYARFFRWASDRLDANGVLAFITNRSFIDSRTFDGFRSVVQQEFNEIYVIDLGGDVRENPKLSGTKHNVFGIQTGVAISFMLKREKASGCKIFYTRRPELETAEEKLAFLENNTLPTLSFSTIDPDPRFNWVNLGQNDFDTFMPVATRETKAAKKASQEKAIFRQYSFGVVTNRDEWVYGFSKQDVSQKVRFLVDAYNLNRNKIRAAGAGGQPSDIDSLLDGSIKWTRALKRDLLKGVEYSFDGKRITKAMYRPFVERFLYFSPKLNEMPNLMPKFFGEGGRRRTTAIVFTDPTAQKPFMALATDVCPDMHMVGAAAGSVVLPFTYAAPEPDASTIENVTGWALRSFQKRYPAGRGKRARRIAKIDIFHYVYAVLHDPVYRERYELNLKRTMPRVPFYSDFWQWTAWGKSLLELHLGFRTAARHELVVEESPSDDSAAKAILRANVEKGSIVLDSRTVLRGIPAAAWEYELGGRSAISWILDQYRERKTKNPAVEKTPAAYRLADHRSEVIALLERVVTVSVETMRIVNSMRTAER
jgi:predicted helicase